jgi:hypothetical protein
MLMNKLDNPEVWRQLLGVQVGAKPDVLLAY